MTTLLSRRPASTKSYGEARGAGRRRPAGRRAACSRCSVRTAPARPRSCGSCRRCCARTPAGPVAGFDVVRERGEVRRAISLTGQSVAIDDLQTGEENLRMMARLAGSNPRGPPPGAPICSRSSTCPMPGDRRVVKYSGGMRRRLDLAAGLVGRPSVIFLDEPTTGLDLPSRQAMWRISRVRDDRRHRLPDHAVPGGGRPARRPHRGDERRPIVAQGTPAALKAQVADQRLDITLADAAALDAAPRALGDRVITVDRVQRRRRRHRRERRRTSARARRDRSRMVPRWPRSSCTGARSTTSSSP